MARFVKEGAFGGYKDVPGGQSDPEYTHVILSGKEYTQLCRERDTAVNQSRSTKLEADKDIKRAREDAQRKVQQAETDAQQKIAAVEQELLEAQTEITYQRDLNANLLRIARERANADRKLKPKKDHTGYVVVVTEDKEYRYRDGKKWKKIKLKETVLQSHYSVDFSEEEARIQIERELFPEGGDWLIARIGITGRYGSSYEDMIENTSLSEDFLERNILLAGQQRLRANFRSGYWELVFMHTKALGIVPPEMRAR